MKLNSLIVTEDRNFLQYIFIIKSQITEKFTLPNNGSLKMKGLKTLSLSTVNVFDFFSF